MSLFQHNVVVLDTETNGLLDAPWAGIVEIGAVLLDVDGHQIDCWQMLVIPEVLDGRCAEAFAINGLTASEIEAEGVQPMVALRLFNAWLKDKGRPWLAAYGLDFDRGMLARMGLRGHQWMPCIQATAKEAMEAVGQRPWLGRRWPHPRLTEAAHFYGVVPEEPSHRALSDAATAAKVLVEIRHRGGDQ